LLVRVVDASAVRGVAHARTVGTAAAEAPIVAYCDADDVVARGWLSALYGRWIPGAVVAGSLEHDLLNASAQVKARGRLQSRELALLMDFLPVAAGCNLLMEKAVLDGVGGWRIDLKNGEDAEFCWRLQLSGHPLLFAPEAVVHYRLRGNARAMFRQIFWYNEPYPRLYKEYRAVGAKRRRPRKVAERYLWVVTRLPYLLLGQSRRTIWCVVAAQNAGRLAGSVRYRSLCL
jgi:GT2 family glycosyltransferase